MSKASPGARVAVRAPVRTVVVAALLLAACASGEAATAQPPSAGSASGGASAGTSTGSAGTGRVTGRPRTAPPSRSSARWRPRPGTTWQWQLSGPLDLSVDAEVYDVDLVTTSAAEVAELHRRGRRVICYLSAGSYEPYRPDSARFPAAVLGTPLVGWPDERWLDVRRLDVLEPLLAARLDLCRAKGFDGVEADNVDGYTQRTGFPLTAADQLRFNRRLATLAHARGLAIGLKNDLDQVPALVDHFDFAVNEECFEYDECAALTPFVTAGKAVFHAEYEHEPDRFCPTSARLQLSSIRKEVALGAWRRTC